MKFTYVFATGRQSRIDSDVPHATEMFYGFEQISKKYRDSEIIELHDHQKLINKVYLIIDKVINKLTKLPFNMNNVTSKENYKKIVKSDYLIISIDRLAISLLPIILLSKLRRKNINISFFVMGLLDKKKLNKLQELFSKKILIILFKSVNNIIFLGEEEYNIANKLFDQYSLKFHFLPFMVDFEFWKNDDESKQKSGILFVGNDSNREFDKVIQIATILKQINFTIISKYYRINKIDINLPNVEIIDGSWGNQKLTDGELRDYYTKSKLVIIPLKESNQPSGQSVALQSMTTKTPVMITKTSGFWDKTSFSHLENVVLIENNSIDNWIRKINEIYSDELMLKKLADNAFLTIKTRYTDDLFFKKLSKILEI
tara:strand:+ start:330 stop:1445 length:1116 start_codon:yes stop_codon:yes gene_type:complete